MNDARGYQLEAATLSCIPQLMQWFTTVQACLNWGGIEFRFPFTRETFTSDCRIAQLPSFVLTERAVLCAFGQYYERVGRCHLGRLAVAPTLRGRGIGTQLVRQLAAAGSAALAATEISLFVSRDNKAAEALYTRLGFRELAYPDASSGTTAYRYMVATAATLR
jgi:ribosomal protein S18 acetylase RimI-like enzyme